MQASPDPWMGSDDWGGDATGKATPPPEVPDAVPPQPVTRNRLGDRSALKIERDKVAACKVDLDKQEQEIRNNKQLQRKLLGDKDNDIVRLEQQLRERDAYITKLVLEQHKAFSRQAFEVELQIKNAEIEALKLEVLEKNAKIAELIMSAPGLNPSYQPASQAVAPTSYPPSSVPAPVPASNDLSVAPPAQGLPDWIELRNAQPFCLLCWKYISGGHLISDTHQWREANLNTYLHRTYEDGAAVLALQQGDAANAWQQLPRMDTPARACAAPANSHTSPAPPPIPARDDQGPLPPGWGCAWATAESRYYYYQVDPHGKTVDNTQDWKRPSRASR